MDWILAATGMLVAMLVTLTGVGGGALMTPALIFGFGLTPATAVGTDLLYAVFTKSGALLVHLRDRRVDWSAAGWMLGGSVPTALLAGGVLALLHGGSAEQRLVRLVVAAALLPSVVSLLYRRSSADRLSPSPARPLALVTGGTLVGGMVALSSIGAGTLGTALLARLHPNRSLSGLVGTELAQAVPLAALAAAEHLLLGQLDWHVALDLTLGALPGIWLGRRLARRLSDRWLRLVLAAALGGAAARLIV